MNIVLLPTDFSENAKKASRYALQLFRDNPTCKFILLNAYSIPYPATDITFQSASATLISLSNSLKKESEEALLKEKKGLQNISGRNDQTIEVRSEHGHITDIIERLQKADVFDGIVMGTKGASGLTELLGSNASSIIRRVKCPLVIVPENSKIKPPKKITFAADFKALKNQEPLTVLKSIAKKFDAEVMVLNVLKNGNTVQLEEAEDAFVLHNFLEGINHDFYTATDSKVDKGIDQFIHTNTTDLLVMTTEEHSFFHRLFNPSITKKMVLHTDIPTLILHT